MWQFFPRAEDFAPGGLGRLGKARSVGKKTAGQPAVYCLNSWAFPSAQGAPAACWALGTAQAKPTSSWPPGTPGPMRRCCLARLCHPDRRAKQALPQTENQDNLSPSALFSLNFASDLFFFLGLRGTRKPAPPCGGAPRAGARTASQLLGVCQLDKDAGISWETKLC